MFRHSLRSCATVGSLCLLVAVACEQKSESTPPGSTTSPSPAATPSTTPTPGTTGPAATQMRPSTTGAGGAAAAVREETLPVSGTDTEPMGGGGHAGAGGHGGHAGKSSH